MTLLRLRPGSTVVAMTALQPYLALPGTAREALTFYADVFGGEVSLFTFEQFNRQDGPADAIAHGELSGPVGLAASDTTGDEPALRVEGIRLALLGTAEPDTMRQWFARLADQGSVLDDLQERAWGDWDGQVVDRFGVPWLIGFHPEG